MNRFNYVLAIGNHHTILDKSLLSVNNTLIFVYIIINSGQLLH